MIDISFGIETGFDREVVWAWGIFLIDEGRKVASGLYLSGNKIKFDSFPFFVS
jgi:hypothetical protein